MAFYLDMQQVARDLLKPDTAGGLGQGKITLRRETPGDVDENEPWIPVPPNVETETFDQISSADTEYTVGGTIYVTDTAFMLTAPKVIMPQPGDIVEVGGEYVGGVVHVSPFPAHGVTVYVKIYVNK